jgi:hypothetical protein
VGTTAPLSFHISNFRLVRYQYVQVGTAHYLGSRLPGYEATLCHNCLRVRLDSLDPATSIRRITSPRFAIVDNTKEMARNGRL